MTLSGAASVTIDPLTEADRERAVRLLAEVFSDEPLDAAVVGGSPARRRRCSRAGMEASLAAAHGRADARAARRAGDLVGVLVAVPPTAQPLPPPSLGVQLRTYLRQGPRVAGRWRRVYEALVAERPAPPAWHLSLLGVATGCQGRGIGGRLLEDWLRTVDRAREAAWLETARPANVPFYERRGFVVRRSLEILSIPIWQMFRPGAPSSAAM